MSWEGPVALAGVILGVGNATFLAIKYWLEHRFNVQVSVSEGTVVTMPTYPEKPEETGPWLFIEAKNFGMRPVIISGVDIATPDLKYCGFIIHDIDSLLPHVLNPSTSYRIKCDPFSLEVDLRKLNRGSKVKVIGIVHDQLGSSFKSKPFLFPAGKYHDEAESNKQDMD